MILLEKEMTGICTEGVTYYTGITQGVICLF
jgi:hypothetical protein